MFDCDISLIIPLHNEQENLNALYEGIRRVFDRSAKRVEMIFVDDGSTDGSHDVLSKFFEKDNRVCVIRLSQCRGKAKALEHGFQYVTGQYTVIMDADLQYDPADVIKFVEHLELKRVDVVSGDRVHRADSGMKLLSSSLFNMMVRGLLGLNLRDYFSGLKAFRTEVLQTLKLHGDQIRFAIVFAHRAGFRVAEIPIQHYQRGHGVSQYNSWARIRRAFSDLTVMMFYMVFKKNIVVFWGWIGIFSLLAAAVLKILDINQFISLSVFWRAFLRAQMNMALVLILMGAVGWLFYRDQENESRMQAQNIAAVSDGRISH